MEKNKTGKYEIGILIALSINIWKETANVFHKKDENHDYKFPFITYQKNDK